MCVRSVPFGAAFLLSSLLISLPARADDARSVGTPQAGRLVGGVELPARGDGWEFRSNREHPTAHFGTGGLVQTIVFAIATVRERLRDGTLVVQDMSLPEGGHLEGHLSHTSGRDADLRFYALDRRGEPVVTDHDVPYAGDGRARDGTPVRFDDARNWALVAGLLESPWADVQAIFIHPALERRLVAYGRRHAPRELVERAAHRMMPAGTRQAAPHDDHLHVRIACPADDASGLCEDRFARRRPRVTAARATRRRPPT